MKKQVYVCDVCGKEFDGYPSIVQNVWVRNWEREGRTLRLNIKVHIYESGKGDRSEINDADLCAECMSRVLGCYAQQLKGENNGTQTN